MEQENCEGHNGRALFMVVPKVALLAAVVGVGACIRRRREHHQHGQSDALSGHARHGGCARPHHCGCRDHEVHLGGRVGGGPEKSKVDSLRILEKRFASGEIEEDEFRRRWSVLHENGS